MALILDAGNQQNILADAIDLEDSAADYESAALPLSYAGFFKDFNQIPC
jgi:hypothetical protein